MTLLLGMLLAFVLGWIVGAAAYYAAVFRAVQHGQWHKVPGFDEYHRGQLKPPQPKGEEPRWN